VRSSHDYGYALVDGSNNLADQLLGRFWLSALAALFTRRPIRLGGRRKPAAALFARRGCGALRFCWVCHVCFLFGLGGLGFVDWGASLRPLRRTFFEDVMVDFTFQLNGKDMQDC